MINGGMVLAAVLVLIVGQPFGQSHWRTASQFASNGYLGVLTSARFSVDDIDWLDVRLDVDAQSDTTERVRRLAHDTDIELTRALKALSRKRHIVLIVEESFSGPVWEQQDLRRKFLPNFTKLAAESVVFTNLFATGSRTTRGMEALLNGFPPLPGISTTERVGYERLPSLARALGTNGFYPVFLYGGWPDFSNFSNYWDALGFRETFSREDFNEPFETSWGIADEALFERLVTQMDALTQHHDRVFLATLTVSHHRPYDFPRGAVDWPAEERRSDYAMAYADHSLGQFFTAAKRTAWYADTLFVVVADHGPQPIGDELIPAGSYKIPLLLHAQGLPPRTLDNLGSSMSLATTILPVFDLHSHEEFAGENLFCACDTVVPLEYDYHVGLLERDALHVIRAEGDMVSWSYDLPSNRLSAPKAQSDPSIRRRILEVFAPSYQRFYERP